MSCTRMETKILPYVDGRLKESERLEVEKHLAGCSTCRLRVNEFRWCRDFWRSCRRSSRQRRLT